MQYGGRAASQSWVIFSRSLRFVLSFLVIFIILLYLIFILRDYEVLAKGWKSLIPAKYKVFVLQLTDDIEISMNKYFRGQALIASTVGVLFATGFYIIDLRLQHPTKFFIKSTKTNKLSKISTPGGEKRPTFHGP